MRQSFPRKALPYEEQRQAHLALHANRVLSTVARELGVSQSWLDKAHRAGRLPLSCDEAEAEVDARVAEHITKCRQERAAPVQLLTAGPKGGRPRIVLQPPLATQILQELGDGNS